MARKKINQRNVGEEKEEVRSSSTSFTTNTNTNGVTSNRSRRKHIVRNLDRQKVEEEEQEEQEQEVVEQEEDNDEEEEHDEKKRRNTSISLFELQKKRVKSSLWFGTIEACLMIIEHIVVLTFTSKSLQVLLLLFFKHSSASASRSIPSPSAILQEHEFLHLSFYIISQIATTLWILWRNRYLIEGGLSSSSSSSSSSFVLPKYFGILRPKFTLLSFYIFFILTFHLFLFRFILPQLWPNSTSNLISFDNHLKESDGSWDYSKTTRILILSPISEEVFFRGVLFYILFNRGRHLHSSIITSNVLFGLFHFLNLLNTTGMSFSYVLGQVFLGVLIGVFYSLRFIWTKSLWEGILLHFLNNVFASLLDFKLFSFDNPAFFCIFFETFLIYTLLVKFSFTSTTLLQPKSSKQKKR